MIDLATPEISLAVNIAIEVSVQLSGIVEQPQQFPEIAQRNDCAIPLRQHRYAFRMFCYRLLSAVRLPNVCCNFHHLFLLSCEILMI